MQYIRKKVKKSREKRDTARGGAGVASEDAGLDEGAPPPQESKGLEEGAVSMKEPSCQVKSSRAIMLAGFALAIDFTMALMSIQTFYYALGGPKRLYGLTFGSYDLSALLVAPLLGLWNDTFKVFKIPILACLAMNGAGNLVYAMSYLGDAWWMMLLGRFVAGIGAAALALGSSYIANTTTMEQRQARLGTYRVSQSLARTLGPYVGFLFLGLPAVSTASSTALQVFNWYTIPGWAALFVIIMVFVPFSIMFQDPTAENGHLIGLKDDDPVDKETMRARKRDFTWFSSLWLFLVFASTFLQFAYYSNLFALFAGQYHEVQDQYDQWKVFVALGAGAVPGAVAYRVGLKVYPKVFDERLISIAASILLIPVYMLVIPYGGEASVPAPATYYASTALFGVSVVMGSPALETVFSKKITQYRDVVGENISKLLGLYFMSVSAGRFGGPLVACAVTYIATTSGQQQYCQDGIKLDDDGSPICAGDTDQSCAIFSDGYFTEGCVLKHAIPFLSTIAAVAACIAVSFIIMIRRYWSYKL